MFWVGLSTISLNLCTQAAINPLPYLLWAWIVINTGGECEHFSPVLMGNMKEVGGKKWALSIAAQTRGRKKVLICFWLWKADANLAVKKSC